MEFSIQYSLHREEVREKNMSTLHSNMDILISGLSVFVPVKYKDNITVSMVCNTGETGDIL